MKDTFSANRTPDGNGRKGVESGFAVDPKIGFAALILCLAVLILAVLVMAAVPPVSRDALTHHLAVPKLWIKNGGLVEIPSMNVSYYPMNLNLLYVIPMLLGNDIAPKYIHFFFALATSALIYSFLRQRTTRFFSLAGVILFLSTPVVVKLSITAYVDLGLVFFSWASIYYLLVWARSIEKRKYLILAAVCCGLGLGTKYSGMIVLLLLTFSVAWIYARSTNRAKVRASAAIGYPAFFFVVSMVVFSPWLIKNYYLTRNPVYPLYKGVLGSGPNRSVPTNLAMKPWLQRKVIYGESLTQTALIPVRIFFQGEDDNPRLFDGRLNPILLVFPLLLLIHRKGWDAGGKLEILILSVFAGCFLLYASFMVDMRIRYIAPIVPPLTVLSILAMARTFDWLRGIDRKKIARFCQWTAVATLVILLSMNASYIAALFQSVKPVPFLLGQVSREQYLTEHLPDYPAIQYVNRIDQEGLSFLALFLGKRLYYFDKHVEFDTQTFEKMVVEAENAKEISSRMQNKGYSYCIIGIGHFEAWVNRIFDEPQKNRLSQWLRNDCRLLFSQNGYAVFELQGTGL